MVIIFTDMTKSHLILKNQLMRKPISLGYICRNNFSPIKIILKLTLLFQLFSKLRENVIWLMKAKPTISAKMFFRKTLNDLCIETDNSAYFWRFQNKFGKSNCLIKENFVGKNFRREKFSSPSQNFVNFL